ncbi:MAG: choice-of-anchor V domain-containing protein [Bacteroidia bacterium]
MKKVKFTFLLSLLFLAGQVFTYTSGPPAANTNAPGETACGGCHGTATTSGTEWSGMSLTTTSSLGSLQPNTTYPMTLSFTSSTSNKLGFMLCALPGSAISSTGSLGTIGVTNSIQTQTTSSGNRTYLTHTSGGTSTATGTKTWTFNFTTPASYNGGATFYVCVNATDANNSSSGDEVFAKTFSVNVLPVKWLDLSAENVNGKNLVKWSTSMELNTSYFELESSLDGDDFKGIQKIQAAGNSSTSKYYSIVDDNPENHVVYYRIKQVDRDGVFAYSNVFKTQNAGHESSAEISYNSESKTLFVRANETSGLELYNLNGELVKSFQSTSQNRFDMTGIQNGMYLIKLKHSNQAIKKLLIQ